MVVRSVVLSGLCRRASPALCEENSAELESRFATVMVYYEAITDKQWLRGEYSAEFPEDICWNQAKWHLSESSLGWIKGCSSRPNSPVSNIPQLCLGSSHIWILLFCTKLKLELTEIVQYLGLNNRRKLVLELNLPYCQEKANSSSSSSVLRSLSSCNPQLLSYTSLKTVEFISLTLLLSFIGR